MQLSHAVIRLFQQSFTALIGSVCLVDGRSSLDEEHSLRE